MGKELAVFNRRTFHKSSEKQSSECATRLSPDRQRAKKWRKTTRRELKYNTKCSSSLFLAANMEWQKFTDACTIIETRQDNLIFLMSMTWNSTCFLSVLDWACVAWWSHWNQCKRYPTWHSRQRQTKLSKYFSENKYYSNPGLAGSSMVLYLRTVH